MCTHSCNRILTNSPGPCHSCSVRCNTMFNTSKTTEYKIPVITQANSGRGVSVYIINRISMHMMKCPDWLMSAARGGSPCGCTCVVSVTSDRLRVHSARAITKDILNVYRLYTFVNVTYNITDVINRTPANIEHRNGHFTVIPFKPRTTK